MILLNIVVGLVIYSICIKTINSGRCFRYEYFIKTVAITGAQITSFFFMIFHVPLLGTFAITAMFVLAFYNLKFTIQRLYDLNLSRHFSFFNMIPVVSAIMTLCLYFIKGKPGINKYDKAVDYAKLFKGVRFIDIGDKKIKIDHNEFAYEMYLGKYHIKIARSVQNNAFAEYIKANFPTFAEPRCTVTELTNEEMEQLIEQFNLMVVHRSLYVRLKGYKVFIRRENFAYTIILDKAVNTVSKELFDLFDFPGSFSEDEKYVYYNRIGKNELLTWAQRQIKS